MGSTPWKPVALQLLRAVFEQPGEQEAQCSLTERGALTSPCPPTEIRALPGVNPTGGEWNLIVLAVAIRLCLSPAAVCRLLAQGQRLLKLWEGFSGG